MFIVFVGLYVIDKKHKSMPKTDKIVPKTDKIVPKTDKIVPKTDKIVPRSVFYIYVFTNKHLIVMVRELEKKKRAK